MCSITSNWQRFFETRWGLVAAVCAVALSGAAILPRPGLAADDAAKDKAAEAAQKNKDGGRVFSKDQPFFKREIPQVTPGPDGSTKAEIITEPNPAPEKQGSRKTATPVEEIPAAKDAAPKKATATQNDKTPKKSKSAGTEAPAVRIINDANAGEPKTTPKPDVAPAPKPAPKVAKPVIKNEPPLKREAAAKDERKSKNTRAADRAKKDAPKDRRDVAEAGPEELVALPVRKPPIPGSQRGRGDVAQSKARATSGSDRSRQAYRELLSPNVDPYYTAPRNRPASRRPPPVRRTARKQERYDPPPVQRRHRKLPNWRRGAPPGATGSFVRCYSDGRCVRYYRVRRPRNFREFRRLRRWERRQRRAARYRARWRRYLDDY